MQHDEIDVAVAYALPGRHIVLALRVPGGTTAREAIELSGLAREFPEVATLPFGIYGKVVPPSTRLDAGDRVEIYRPLTADPKLARRRRAAQQTQTRDAARRR
jgi:putative ubiquitin-RnfH superfamily antitoxin RatB of RatAB toxin-antitoxin module